MKKMPIAFVLALAVAIGASTGVALEDYAVGMGIGAAVFVIFFTMRRSGGPEQ